MGGPSPHDFIADLWHFMTLTFGVSNWLFKNWRQAGEANETVSNFKTHTAVAIHSIAQNPILFKDFSQRNIFENSVH